MRRLHIILFILLAPMFAMAAGPGCFSLFLASAPTQFVYSEDGQFASPLVESITPANLHSVFAHSYLTNNPGTLGAKAIGLALPGERPQIYFFATGEGSKTWGVHHMDALSTVLRERGLIRASDKRVTSELLPYVQGYELSMVRQEQQWRVSELRIDSGITSLQVVSGVPLSLPSQQSMLTEIKRLIPRELRSFEVPGFPPNLQFREWLWMRLPGQMRHAD